MRSAESVNFSTDYDRMAKELERVATSLERIVKRNDDFAQRLLAIAHEVRTPDSGERRPEE